MTNFPHLLPLKLVGSSLLELTASEKPVGRVDDLPRYGSRSLSEMGFQGSLFFRSAKRRDWPKTEVPKRPRFGRLRATADINPHHCVKLGGE
ncbi:MAG: hypothetical protein ACLPX7_09555 [Xanthobacteraceae bacterium]